MAASDEANLCWRGTLPVTFVSTPPLGQLPTYSSSSIALLLSGYISKCMDISTTSFLHGIYVKN